ncbi:MAG TPA: glycoside hydrolase family 2 TIM barrel-domain containing protein [Chthonomonadaceae bacterium]|nr:glycoside hydrolase family 2 TIM barrel-domain containing protein [Chthonomonadaceae bacterium]
MRRTLLAAHHFAILPRVIAVTVLILFVLFPRPRCLAAEPSRADGFAWMEGEAPASANVKFQAAGWGHKEFLSGEKWLQISIEADKVDRELPAGGAVLEYRFQAPASGRYEIWNRIGYEFVRSPFEWRVDGGAWARIGAEQLTTDLMELQDWNEVAWLKMGDQPLAPGAHKLFIRLPKTLDDKGKTAKVLYASDALCVHLGRWSPYSHFKPGEDWRDARDRAAAHKVFQPPDAAIARSPGRPAPDTGRGGVQRARAEAHGDREGRRRFQISLAGDWEVCRDDEQIPGEVATPMRGLPAAPHWRSIRVPSDKMQIPELVMAHRLWYRTRLEVPAALAGRSFRIVFPQNSLNTTVIVNGVPCGFDKNPLVHFAIDITRGVKPGVNEILVGIRDAYYGYSADPDDPMKLRRKFNLPLSFSHQGFQDMAYPVWGAFQSGILAAPTLIVDGPVYASDVFIKPSVANKELTAEITITNTLPKPVAGTITCNAREIESARNSQATAQLRRAPEGHSAEGPGAKLFTSSDSSEWTAAIAFSLAVGETKRFTIAKSWAHPNLWWPDAPTLYNFRTSVAVAGAVGAARVDPFGFREWTVDGINLKLNGVNYHAYGDAHGGGSPDEWLAFHRKTHQTAMRFWGTDWKGMTPDDALDWMDRNGLVVRRQGMLDGEAIGYMAIETDPKLKAKYHSEVKMDLMQNWRDQMVAQVMGERNHPSVMVWSIENEWLYINCINLYGGMMDAFEAEVKKTSDAVRQADPTRPTMTDGGGANRDQSMPIHGNHYVSGPMRQYPALAYSENPTGGGRGRWVWDEKRPRFLGEDFFFAGNHPELSAIGGEAVFAGKQAQLPASSLMQRILHEGYRWADFAGWDLYVQPGDGNGSQYNSLSPRAVLCRQWDWSFGAGQQVKRDLAIFNDTHDAAPIEFTWSLTVDGQRVAGQTTQQTVAPGTNEKLEITLPIPDAAIRKEGELALSLRADGREVYRDTKTVSVLPALAAAPASSGLERITPGQLAVFDPAGGAAAMLARLGLPFTPVASLGALPEQAKVLIVGRDALDAAESASSRLAAYAAGGRAVIVLEQKNPLRYQALPAQMEAAENEGRAAFAEDLTHPALRGLQQKDLFVWGPDEIVYRNAYRKPERGGRSLIQCDQLLQYSALVEVPAGEGVLLLSQLALEEKIATNAVAQQLFVNLLTYGTEYRRTYRPVAALVEPGSPLAKAIDATGLSYAKASDPLAAIALPVGASARPSAARTAGGASLRGPARDPTLAGTATADLRQAAGRPRRDPLAPEAQGDPANGRPLREPRVESGPEGRAAGRGAGRSGTRLAHGARAAERVPGGQEKAAESGAIAIIAATPANLKLVADHLDRVTAFTEAGGWILFNGLTPEGLADYNRIVGFDHMIRPFRRERVTFPPVRGPLTAGIPTGDVVMYSSKRIFDYQEGAYVVADEFQYVVDIDEVAPFGKSTFFAYDNIVNNFVSADGWPLIINFPINKDNSPFDIPITLPKPQTITEFTWIGNTFYYPQTRLNLVFEGADGKRDIVPLKVEPTNEPQTFRIDPPRTARRLTLQIAEWIVKPGVAPNIGIDNIYLKAQRPPDFSERVRPLLNIGGMVEYRRGAGGIVLCNLNFKESEEVPENAVKKRNILAALLGNLKAPFTGGGQVIAGAHLKYTPLDLSKQANGFRDERGWFGDKRFTFKELPTGRHIFAGVLYDVYDFPTSPVPTAILLAGSGVPGVMQQAVRGIPVHRKAAALFFLQAARIDARRSPQEVRQGRKVELARYVVHYADGQTAIVPVYSEIDVDNYRQTTPRALPGAQIAWTAPFAGSDQSAVAYSQQWDNPRPYVQIDSIDLVAGPESIRGGVPALLAVTAANPE